MNIWRIPSEAKLIRQLNGIMKMKNMILFQGLQISMDTSKRITEHEDRSVKHKKKRR